MTDATTCPFCKASRDQLWRYRQFYLCCACHKHFWPDGTAMYARDAHPPADDKGRLGV